jgi:predicted HicB family RNase H-like nuclease
MHEFPYRPEVTDTTETPSAPSSDHSPEHPSPSTIPPDFSEPAPFLEPVSASEFTQPDLATETATPPIPVLPADRRQEIFRVAGEMYRQAPDWVMFFREILGVDGIVRRMFRNADELAAFEKTAEYDEIQLMLAKLREKTVAKTGDNEPTRVITVRLPKSLHESLRTEAHERRTSMNKLCISKLLQVVDNEMVPSE